MASTARAGGAEPASGVRELIARLRGEGIDAGQVEAQALVAAAEAEARRIREAAREEARQLVEQAAEQIARDHEAALESLKVAARDAVLAVRSRLVAAFERHAREVAASELADAELLRAVVVALAGQAAESAAGAAGGVEIAVPSGAMAEVARGLVGGAAAAPGSDRPAALDRAARATARRVLRDGVELVEDPAVEIGARVRLLAEELEIDLGPDAVAALLSRYLVPRYRSMIE